MYRFSPVADHLIYLCALAQLRIEQRALASRRRPSPVRLLRPTPAVRDRLLAIAHDPDPRD